jgi:hypothetical protein
VRAVSTRSARPSPPRVAFLILAILALWAAPARAGDNGWSRLVAAPTEIAPLVSLVVASDGTVYAEADRASFVSHDGAATWQMVGRGYGAPVVDPFDPQHLYTVFNGGDNHDGSIFVTPSSDDGGATWQNLGPAVTGWRCRYVRLIADPSHRGRLYLYTAQQSRRFPAIYRSDDAGQSWSSLTLPYPPRMIDVDADGTVYGATAGHGVLRSVDAGASWTAGSVGIIRDADGRQIVSQVTAAPQSGVAYAVATTGLYRTTDSGAHWTLSTATPPWRLQDLRPDPTDAQRLWGSTGGAELIRSDDGGMTWSDMSPWFSGVTPDPTRHGRLYSTGAGQRGSEFAGAGVITSSDGGETWASAGESLRTPRDFLSFAVSPADPTRAYGIGLAGFYRTTDGGATWSVSTPFRSRESLVLMPGQPDTLFAYTDWPRIRGIMRSGDGGTTWTHVLPRTRVSYVVLGGGSRVYQVGNGFVHVSEDRGLTWRRARVPRATTQIAVDGSGAVRYTLSNDRIMVRTPNGWRRTLPLPERQHAIWIVGDRSDAGVLYARTWSSPGHIFRTIDGGDHWVDVRPPQTMGPIEYTPSLMVDPHDPRVLYFDSGAPARRPILLRSTDRGVHWFTVAGDTNLRTDSTLLPGAGTRLVAQRDDFPTEGGGDIDVYTPVDTDAPWFSVQPVAHVRLGAVLGATVPLAESWRSLDHTSSVTAYRARRTDGDGAPRTLPDPRTASIRYPARPGSRVLVEVQGVDHAGNAGAWRGTAATPWVDGDSNPALHYSRGWRVDRSAASTGGQTHRTDRKGATVTFTFTGRGIAWVGARGSLHGTAGIAIDGAHVASVNLHSPAFAPRRVLFSKSWPTGGVHTLAIASTGGGTIDLDSLIVLR